MPQIEAIGTTVLADFPAFGYARNRYQCLRILCDQVLKERQLYVTLRNASGEMWVDGLWLGAITKVQHAIAITLIHAALSARTGGKNQH